MYAEPASQFWLALTGDPEDMQSIATAASALLNLIMPVQCHILGKFSNYYYGVIITLDLCLFDIVG
jgi:hypothetical protein